MSSYLSIADIALITLRKAGVTRGARPAKTFVMMAAAKPIILAAEGEAEELIASSGAGVIVPPDEPEQFASAILAMHENADGAREMGLRGLAYVREKFEWSKLVGNWLKQLSAAEVAQNVETARVGAVEDRFSKVS